MFPSVNTDKTTLGLPKNCEVAKVITNTVFFPLEYSICTFKKTLYKKKII